MGHKEPLVHKVLMGHKEPQVLKELLAMMVTSVELLFIINTILLSLEILVLEKLLLIMNHKGHPQFCV